MTALSLAPPLPAPAQPGQLTVTEQEQAEQVMYGQLWHVPLAVPDGRPGTNLQQCRERTDACAAVLYTAADPVKRIAALKDLADAYRRMARLTPTGRWQRPVLTGRADLLRAVAATEHLPGRGWNLAPVLAQTAIIPDWDTWTALARTCGHLQRAELLQHLYQQAVADERAGWIATILLALATTETAVAAHPPHSTGA